MALDFLKLTDDKLAQDFNKKPEKDLMPARRSKVLEGIDKALASIKAGEDNPKRGSYSTKEGVSKATLRLGSRKLAVKGTDEFFVPRERLQDFYTQARKSVEAGELDEAIKAALAGKTSNYAAPRAKSETVREIEPWKVYRRNLGRYGQERADELLEKKFGKDAAKVRKDYEANKDS